MKTVQDKDGNIIEVADNTPCHAGKDGALPIMLDEVLDAEIFAELEAREAEYQSKASERLEQEIIDKRKKEYGSPEEQLEYIAENGLEAFQIRAQAIKQKYPKPTR